MPLPDVFISELAGTLSQLELLAQPEIPLSEHELIGLLAEAIDRILERNAERLAQIAYRLDLPEKAFREALEQPEAATLIATLICRRQYEKWQSRRQMPPPAAMEDDLRW